MQELRVAKFHGCMHVLVKRLAGWGKNLGRICNSVSKRAKLNRVILILTINIKFNLIVNSALLSNMLLCVLEFYVFGHW